MTELETKSSDSESENCEEEYQLDLDSDEEVRKDINESQKITFDYLTPIKWSCKPSQNED